MEPQGVVAAGAVWFRWRWNGPPAQFELVVLDEQLDEILRRPVGDRQECRLDAAALPADRASGQLHWFVAAGFGEENRRSAPLLFHRQP